MCFAPQKIDENKGWYNFFQIAEFLLQYWKINNSDLFETNNLQGLVLLEKIKFVCDIEITIKRK